MRSWMIAISLGIFTVSFSPSLPSPGQFNYLLLISLLIVASLCYLFRAKKLTGTLFPLGAGYLIGIIWGALYGYQLIEHRIPAKWEGVDLWVEGIIVGLPKKTINTGFGGRKQTVQRIDFKIDSSNCSQDVKKPMNCSANLNLLRLKWYDAEPVEPGQKWRLRVRLKKPTGLANPGGFDYQSWLITQGYSATGYVRLNKGNTLLGQNGFSIDGFRWQGAVAIEELIKNLENKAIIKALIFGDKRQISNTQWQLFSRTGTSHLMVISGLHVGLISAMGFFFGRLTLLLISRKWSADRGGALCAIIAAALYSAAAGFSLPTQRALAMIVVWMLAIILRRQIAAIEAIITALFICLIIDPLATVSLSFWLSFMAVICIFIGTSGKITEPKVKLERGIRTNWSSQFVVFIGLFPIMAVLLGAVSLISPVANMFMVPLFSLLIVPLNLLAAILLWISVESGLGQGEFVYWIWFIIDWMIDCSFDYLTWLDNLSESRIFYVENQPLTLTVLSFIGAIVLLMPKGFPLKAFGLVLILPLFLHRPTPLAIGNMRLTILDVGQGLSVVVETKNHNLLYDTGPSIGDNFSAVSSAVIPFMRYNGIDLIDTLVLSHGDNDHAGGFRELIRAIPTIGVLYGEAIPELPPMKSQCRSPRRWSWDGITFEILYPFGLGDKFGGNSDGIGGTVDNARLGSTAQAATVLDTTSMKSNNQSCVLMISTGDMRFLLTGDIERKVETRLLKTKPTDLKATVLVAPHHGSATSSSRAFIAAVGPSHVVFSSGYRNQFGHPRLDVMERYRNSGVVIHSTSADGAISISVKKGQSLDVTHFRDSINRYWY